MSKMEFIDPLDAEKLKKLRDVQQEREGAIF